MAKGFVKFNENKCKGCELCAAFCPKKIIRMHPSRINGKGYHPADIPEENMDACIACGSCGLVCPDGAISVYRV